MDYEKLLRQHRKRHIGGSVWATGGSSGSGGESFGADGESFGADGKSSSLVALDYDRAAIKRIIPHREPFLLVDRLTGLDLEQEMISGERHIDPQDPVFTGHFPDFPLYPGCLEQEMIGQLGLCLHYFLSAETDRIGETAAPVPVRATRVLGAYYLEPILPGARVTLLAKKIEFDGFLARMLGQAIVDEKVACVTVVEVCVLE